MNNSNSSKAVLESFSTKIGTTEVPAVVLVEGETITTASGSETYDRLVLDAVLSKHLYDSYGKISDGTLSKQLSCMSEGFINSKHKQYINNKGGKDKESTSLSPKLVRSPSDMLEGTVTSNLHENLQAITDIIKNGEEAIPVNLLFSKENKETYNTLCYEQDEFLKEWEIFSNFGFLQITPTNQGATMLAPDVEKAEKLAFLQQMAFQGFTLKATKSHHSGRMMWDIVKQGVSGLEL